MKNKSFKAIKKFCGKYWRRWTTLAILAMVIYIGFIFYQYIYKAIYQPREIISQRLEIKEQTHKEVMDSYFQRTKNIEIILGKYYPNPFK
jgi:hypothetical protein